jgi:tetratricopeptide (TPR) repeat protein
VNRPATFFRKVLQALTLSLIAIALPLASAGLASASAPQSGLAEVNSALQSGQADKALSTLQSLPQSEAGSAQAHNLKCRVLYTLERWDGAANECEQAVKLDDKDSMNHLWLGRALGEMADKASFVNAYGLAKRTRVEFERAVELDAHNAEALTDLGEFYSDAPGVVGGGTDKATNIAAKLDRVDPVRAHVLRAVIAQQNHDPGTAEAELRQAISASAHPAYQWMKLASFFRKYKRWDDMENAIQSGMAAAERDRHSTVALFNGASVLVKANRNPELAQKLLQLYLAAPNSTEEAPAFEAHVWMARLKAQLGDKAGAREERAAALALASEFKPAQELKF